MVLVEICASSLESVAAAIKAGAHRIELCKDLEVDGLTPEYKNIESALRMIRTTENMKIHVLIRPRPGNFCYSKAEVDLMCEEIQLCREMGVDGVVIGALTPEGDPDIGALQRMLQAAGFLKAGEPEQQQQQQQQHHQQPQLPPLHLVFHRAFDVCRDPQQAFEEIIGLGFQTLLTSGHERKAEEGIPLIAQLVKQAAGRIDIMAGSGVSPQNVLRIIEETGVKAVHLSATRPRGSQPDARPDARPDAQPATQPQAHSNEQIIREVIALTRASAHKERPAHKERSAHKERPAQNNLGAK